MFTQENITRILSRIYADIALFPGSNMLAAVTLLESIRANVNLDRPLDVWDMTSTEPIDPDDSNAVEQVMLMRESYMAFVLEEKLDGIKKICASKPNKAIEMSRALCVEATLTFRSEFLGKVIEGIKKLPKIARKLSLTRYEKLATLMQEYRWADVYSIFYEFMSEDLIDNKQLNTQILVTLAEIVLYYFPEASLSKKYLSLAEKKSPEDYWLKRGWAEYHLETKNIQQAKADLLQCVSKNPFDVTSVNLMGDAFKEEGNLESAETWYHDAIRLNCHQTFSYGRLILLYSDNKLFAGKKDQFEHLFNKIKKLVDVNYKYETLKYNGRYTPYYKESQLYQSCLQISQAFSNNGDMVAATVWLEKAIKLCPNMSSAFTDLGFVHLDTNNLKKAEKSFTEAVKRDSASYQNIISLANLYRKQAKFDESLRLYTRAIDLRPHWRDWTYNHMGNLYSSMQQYANACKHYQLAIKENKNHNVYRENLASTLISWGDDLETRQSYREAEKKFHAALKVVKSSSNWNDLGCFYFRRKNWQQAEQAFNNAIALNGDNPIYFANLGDALSEQERNGEAEEIFLKALSIKKDYEDSAYYSNKLGLINFRRGSYERALEYFQKAQELDPDNPIYIDNVGNAYEQLKKFDMAISSYQSVIRIDPKVPDPYNFLGVLFYKQERYNDALEYFKKAVAADDKRMVFYQNMAHTFQRLFKPIEATESFESAIRLAPDNHELLNEAGVNYFELERYNDAIEMYKRAIKVEPKMALYHRNLGLALRKTGDFQASVRATQKAIDLDSTDFNSWNELGLSLLETEQWEAAIHAFERANQLNTNNAAVIANLSLALVLGGKQDKALKIIQKQKVEVVNVIENSFKEFTGQYEQLSQINPSLFKKA